MKNVVFCTFFDKNFLPKGLSLYSSLKKYHPNVKLWILCMDRYTKEILDKLKLKGITTISLEDFENYELIRARKRRTRVEYYWMTDSTLPFYVMQRNKKTKYVAYIDADIFFFSGAAPAFRELGDGSIFIEEHRYSEGNKYRSKRTGRFNVGFLIFKRDKEGIECLARWRKQCIDWCYNRVENGKFGDQMYLNEWPSLYEKLVISKNLGVNVAPWNINHYKVTKKKDGVYINDDKLICYHFHQLGIRNDGSYEYSSGYTLSDETIKYIYRPYLKQLFKELKRIKKIDPTYKIEFVKKTLYSRARDLIAKYSGPILWRIREVFDEEQ